MRFDGSTESALAIAARFGAIPHGDQVQVATSFGHVYAGAGVWIAREIATGTVHVIDDRDMAGFEQIDADPVAHRPERLWEAVQ